MNTPKYLNIWGCALNYGTDGSEELLGVGLFRADGELDGVGAAWHEHGSLARAFVEGFAMRGVAGEFVRACGDGGGEEQESEETHERA